jgi:hypothetical protein
MRWVGAPERPSLEPVKSAQQRGSLTGILSVGQQIRQRIGEFADLDNDPDQSLERVLALTASGLHVMDPGQGWADKQIFSFASSDPTRQADFAQIGGAAYVAVRRGVGAGVPEVLLEVRDDDARRVGGEAGAGPLDLTITVSANEDEVPKGNYAYRTAYQYANGRAGPPGAMYLFRQDLSGASESATVRFEPHRTIPTGEALGAPTGLVVYMSTRLEDGASNFYKRIMSKPLHRVGTVPAGGALEVSKGTNAIQADPVLDDDRLTQHSIAAGACLSYNKRLLLGDVSYDFYVPQADQQFVNTTSPGGAAYQARLRVHLQTTNGHFIRTGPPAGFTDTQAQSAEPLGQHVPDTDGAESPYQASNVYNIWYFTYPDRRATRLEVQVSSDGGATWARFDEWDLRAAQGSNFAYVFTNDAPFDLTTTPSGGTADASEYGGDTTAYATSIDGDPPSASEDVGCTYTFDNALATDQVLVVQGEAKAGVDGAGGQSEAKVVIDLLDSSGNLVASKTRHVTQNGSGSTGGDFEAEFTSVGDVTDVQVDLYAYAETTPKSGASAIGSAAIDSHTVKSATSDDTLVHADEPDRDPNRLLASEDLEPTLFRAARALYVGDSPDDTIMSLAVPTLPVSEGQFGDYPVLALGRETISALRAGSGEVVFDGRRLLARKGCVGREAHANVEGILAFAAPDGIWRLEPNLSSSSLSRPLHHAQGADFLDALTTRTALGFVSDPETGQRELWVAAGTLTFAHSLDHGRWSILDRSRRMLATFQGRALSIEAADGALVRELASADPIDVHVETTRLDLGALGYWKRLRAVGIRHSPALTGSPALRLYAWNAGQEAFQQAQGGALPADGLLRLGKGLTREPYLRLEATPAPGEQLHGFQLTYEPRHTSRPPDTLDAEVAPPWNAQNGFP